MTGNAAEPPIVAGKEYDEPSAFTPDSLLREARRQKGLKSVDVPEFCVLDPDGDIVRRLCRDGRAALDPSWPCYHSELHRFSDDAFHFGIIGCAVGASYAVLVAEQLFSAGCRLLISMSSAGQLNAVRPPPYFVVIERALRDEGTSYHYLSPSRFSEAPPELLGPLAGAFDALRVPVLRGSSWTTDAPFRETPRAVAARAAEGMLAVEMEAAALYAFARARGRAVLCFAHVTNRMGQAGDFEKGEADGTTDALAVISAAARRLASRASSAGPIT